MAMPVHLLNICPLMVPAKIASIMRLAVHPAAHSRTQPSQLLGRGLQLLMRRLCRCRLSLQRHTIDAR
jgi:ribosomal protein S18 acetylase RimI-like enzyme